MKKVFHVVWAVLLLAGCTSVDRRIEANQALFNSLSAEQQELVKQGRVGIGFTKDMVLLAMGQPDRTWVRTDARGAGETWSYTTWETADGALLYSGWYHRGWWGYPYYGGGYYYLDFPNRRERDQLRVVFREERVVEIEERR